MNAVLSTRDVANLIAVEHWRVRRLFEDGTLPEPARVGNRRVLTPEMLPQIRAALRARGWLRPVEDTACA